ncbi:LamG-like jellyroll fold domain-containing protein [Pseudodesulfovibrio senegalensis]|uniref:LamG domain-containing protein n=1 Tax=Pseudodesulfovibrio senegalensis TaxID=1721087 RepID=A0A6N6N3B4_9BACT|nr:LamG-like jellyroll fold domain-containing protein [Pseudodesulfovibrio senegalensis]KAB1441546.1 hypothetical protein F8A88_11465 [Pseudodesulfovibrio senegalensis]
MQNRNSAMHHVGWEGPRSGVAIIYIIIGVVVFGLLGAGIVSFVSTSSVGTAEPDCAKRAQYVAESGIRYAMSEMRAATDSSDADQVLADMNATTYTLADGSTFYLTFTDNRPDFTVRSVGTACNGLSPTTATLEYDFNAPSSSGSDGPITSDDDSKDFVTVADDGNPGITTVEDAQGKVTVVFGNSNYGTYGCRWYEGDKASCEKGVCGLGTGLRTYFVLDFDANAQGDGITFTIKNADTNALMSCGGDSGMGELLGYAGKGFDGKGISPPKLGTEFDIYYNGNNSPCNAGSRNDASNRYDHVAFIYWGETDDSCWRGRYYDDNRHEEGDDISSEPRNSYDWNDSGIGNDGYFYRSYANWLKDGYNGSRVAVARIELHRSQTPNAAGYYLYNLRGWIRQANDTMETGYRDVTTDFDVAPDFVDVIALDATRHAQMNTIYWGWTSGTGAATQFVQMGEWQLAFRGDTASTPATWNNRVPSDYVMGWTIDEGAGYDIHDESSTGADGEVNPHSNGSERLTYAEWVAGLTASGGAGLRTIRSSNNRRPGHILIPYDSSMDLSPRGSVSLWFNPNQFRSGDNRYGLLRKGSASSDSSDPDYMLRLVRSGGSRYYLQGTVTLNVLGWDWPISVASSTVLQNNDDDRDHWHHAVLTWENYTLRLYLDGVLENTYVFSWGTGVPLNTATPVIIGATRARNGTNTNNYCLDGVVDQVFLFDRELTPDEISTIYQAGTM